MPTAVSQCAEMPDALRRPAAWSRFACPAEGKRSTSDYMPVLAWQPVARAACAKVDLMWTIVDSSKLDFITGPAMYRLMGSLRTYSRFQRAIFHLLQFRLWLLWRTSGPSTSGNIRQDMCRLLISSTG